jgi:regulator of cell morphogenesis and NO signaling
MYQSSYIHLTSDTKLSDVIMNNPYLLLLMEHFGIEVPLQDRTLNQVCKQYGINIELFFTFANLYNGINYTPKNPLTIQDTPTIINYLKNSHKYYAEEIYPNILGVIHQMAEVNDFKEMALVPRFFVDYFNDVTEHLEYENKTVYPYIIHLIDKIKGNENSDPSIAYSVVEYKEHHNDIEEKLNDLKSLLIKYLPPKNDQTIRRKLLFLLSELEYDLNIHSKIEELILIPLVVAMELQLKKLK